MRGDTNAGYCSIRFFSASSGLASKGVMTTVVRNSKTKLIPIITAKTKISQGLPFFSGSRQKEVMENGEYTQRKIPVFMIGARTDATITDDFTFFLQ